VASCEKCWWDAHIRVREGLAPDVATAYHQLLKERKDNPCTPQEQAGEFWNEEKQCDSRLTHQ